MNPVFKFLTLWLMPSPKEQKQPGQCQAYGCQLSAEDGTEFCDKHYWEDIDSRAI